MGQWILVLSYVAIFVTVSSLVLYVVSVIRYGQVPPRFVQLTVFGSFVILDLLMYFLYVADHGSIFARVIFLSAGAFAAACWWKIFKDDDRRKRRRKRLSEKGKELLAKMGPARTIPKPASYLPLRLRA